MSIWPIALMALPVSLALLVFWFYRWSNGGSWQWWKTATILLLWIIASGAIYILLQ